MVNSFPIAFNGPLPASKSVLNRLLIIKSFFPNLAIEGHSNAADVRYLSDALEGFARGDCEFDCGEAGTVFRFFALRVSRAPGKYLLRGSERLLSRPQLELLRVFQQLGVEAKLSADGLHIDTQGWKLSDDGIHIDQSESSQFASAVFLSAWDLPRPLLVRSGSGVSADYLELTLSLVASLGMAVERSANGWSIPAQQKLSAATAVAECDISSAAALACAGALAGKVEIQNFPFQSRQPDLRFIDFLNQMNVPVSKSERSLIVSSASELLPLTGDFSNCPDLIPVFSALCSFANGISTLTGATQLKHKESNRLAKSAELLLKAGVQVEILGDDLRIHGQGRSIPLMSFAFDPDQDHRMAMAAGLFMTQGFSIELLTPNVVKKSYPEFWDHLGMTL